mmetsp:Transcript_89443/g.250273  ORF Transcript_89443/g.250273 Transcript_89443/m.250273 type:complete len:207 (+) Transcript_89443:276-896(+)
MKAPQMSGGRESTIRYRKVLTNVMCNTKLRISGTRCKTFMSRKSCHSSLACRKVMFLSLNASRHKLCKACCDSVEVPSTVSNNLDCHHSRFLVGRFLRLLHSNITTTTCTRSPFSFVFLGDQEKVQQFLIFGEHCLVVLAHVLKDLVHYMLIPTDLESLVASGSTGPNWVSYKRNSSVWHHALGYHFQHRLFGWKSPSGERSFIFW